MYKIIDSRKRYATIAADLLGSLIYGPARLLRRPEAIRPEQVREILVIRTAYIGDVVMTIPILRPLRQRFPQARITFLTAARAKAVLEGNPDLDAVLSYDPFWFYPTARAAYPAFMRELRRLPFDLVIEARADIRELFFLVRPLRARYKVSYDVGGGGYLLSHVVPYPGLKHKVEYHLDIARYLGCDVGPVTWGIHLNREELDKVDALLGRAGVAGHFIAIHPGSRMPLKTWFPERFAALCDALAGRYGLPVVLLGAPERACARRADRRGRDEKDREPRRVARPARARRRARARSGAGLQRQLPDAHRGGDEDADGRVFGPSKSVETAPYATVSRVVEKDYPCRVSCNESICRNGAKPHGCMRDIAVADVLRAVEEILAE